MAGSSMTFTYDDGADGTGLRGGLRKVIADWVSDDTTGAVSGTCRKVVGELVKITTDPGGTAPSDNYDVAIADEEGVNVLGTIVNSAALGTRDTANTEETYLNITDGTAGISMFPVVADALTISIANAGNSKTGQLILFYRPQ